MNRKNRNYIKYLSTIAAALLILMLLAAPATSGEYAALEGVDSLKVVFNVGLESPAMANIVFGAITDVYTNESVRTLPQPPKAAIVFHGPAVKLISTNREGLEASDIKALDTFADTIRKMKKDGVRLEVCDYALKVMGIDPASILPEVDHVGNGFISIAGYQAKGYSVITIP